MNAIKKAGIIGCSDGLSPEKKPQVEQLQNVLEGFGLKTARAAYTFEEERTYPGNGKLRAAELMKFYENPEITDIFDVSGGNQGNEVLADLDYEKIRKSPAVFWGYSDLTTVVNAIYAKTGKTSMLYQARFLVGDKGELQQKRFHNYLQFKGDLQQKYLQSYQKSPSDHETISHNEDLDFIKKDLTNLKVTRVQGGPMEGILVGGNIRCFLKLAGTEYFPDLTDKILLLEAWSGQLPQILTYLNQYKQLGAFSKVKGILLGTFTEYEKNQLKPDLVELVKDLAGPDLPIYTTREVGHGHDAKAAVIGGFYRFG